VSPRNRFAEPASLVLYEDPLSPWCLVAERRIVAALEDLPGSFRALRHEPFPTRPEPRALSKRDRRALARTARQAAREPEAAGVTPDLWLSPDPPLSSLPALTALAAARLQGRSREAALRGAIREAALVRGLNVSRADVLIELADRAGLDVPLFASAFAAPASEQRVRDALEEALDRGIREAPALVIGDEWLVVGTRRADDYRAILRRYLATRLGVSPERTLH
jgi:predicted DsbA family dithiol-disulfide isomerase